MKNLVPAIVPPTLDPAVAGLDFGMLTTSDLVNLILQRSEVLSDLPRPGKVIRAWEAGDNAPMRAEVERLGSAIAQRAAAVIAAEYESLRSGPPKARRVMVTLT